MMSLALLVVLVTAGLPTVTSTSLKDTLKSPRDTLKLYQDFKKSEHLQVSPGEERARFAVFRETAELVSRLNEDVTEEAEYELNFFSVMTEDEKKAFLGLNTTWETTPRDVVTPARVSRRRVKRGIPDSKNWVDEGMVTDVQDQAGCGSCWAFGAIASLEGEYKIMTDVLRKFSEQELLDCTYENSTTRINRYGVLYDNLPHDGCLGGWPQTSLVYVEKFNRLASAADYAYHETDCRCEGHLRRNSLIGARVTGNVGVKPETEDAVIEALSEHILAVAFVATNSFHSYKRGLWKDVECKEKSYANHAVTLVGYTPTYALAKNSWSARWGDSGFVRFRRNHEHCWLWKRAFYPTMELTQEVDRHGVDEPCGYDASLTDPHPDCDLFVNSRDDCELKTCDSEDKDSTYWTECKRTCNNCGHVGGKDGACPEGTKSCGGVCKHEHMC